MKPASEVCTVTVSETGLEMVALSKVTRYLAGSAHSHGVL